MGIILFDLLMDHFYGGICLLRLGIMKGSLFMVIYLSCTANQKEPSSKSHSSSKSVQ